MATPEIWQTQSKSWAYLTDKHPSRVSVILKCFELIDLCLDEYQASTTDGAYSRVCGLTLLKAKNFGLGAFALVLNGLGQEAGALVRPMVEYSEMLTYLEKFPEKADAAVDNKLPTAGTRAKAIDGNFKELRDYLNSHASHSSYSNYSLSHLLTPEGLFRKYQEFVPHVVDTNVTSFAVQLLLLTREAIVALHHTSTARSRLVHLALLSDGLSKRMLHVYELEDMSPPQ
jgi:hypothetical protein